MVVVVVVIRNECLLSVVVLVCRAQLLNFWSYKVMLWYVQYSSSRMYVRVYVCVCVCVCVACGNQPVLVQSEATPSGRSHRYRQPRTWTDGRTQNFVRQRTTREQLERVRTAGTPHFATFSTSLPATVAASNIDKTDTHTPRTSDNYLMVPMHCVVLSHVN